MKGSDWEMGAFLECNIQISLNENVDWIHKMYTDTRGGSCENYNEVLMLVC